MRIKRDMFTDPKHPLAHGIKDGSAEWKEVNAVLSARIRRAVAGNFGAIQYGGWDLKHFASVLPNDKTRRPGVSIRRANKVLTEPETATAWQVSYLCMELEVSLDYLRGIEDTPLPILSSPNIEDARYGLERLSSENLAIVCKLIESLLRLQELGGF